MSTPSPRSTDAPHHTPHLQLVSVSPASLSTDELIEQARALERDGRRQEARAGYETALRSLTQPSPALASSLFRWIARSYESDADFSAAEDCAEAALACAESCGEREPLGHALNMLGIVRLRQGQLDQAEQLLNDALARGTTDSNPRLTVDVTTNLGALASVRGDFRQALLHYQQSLESGRLNALPEKILPTLINLGVTNMALGRLDAAETAFVEASDIANVLGDLSYRILIGVNNAALQVERGDFAAATRHCDGAMRLAEHSDDPLSKGEAQKIYGVIARETGDFPAAEARLLEACRVAGDTSSLSLEGEARRELAELYIRLGRNRETLQSLNRAHACFTTLRARHDLADVGRRMLRLEDDFLSIVHKWGVSIESKDVHTQGHCERVADLSTALASRAGLDESSLFWFRIGALLHDVGKLIVPADVLNKPGKLTDEEWALMRRHPAAGVEMLADVEFPWDVTPMVRSHHERWDGRGYPDGLVAAAIPFTARVLCIADVYDALTAQRSYKRAFTHVEAMEIMRREVGAQFDPALFAHFEELVRDGVGNDAMTKGRAAHTGPATIRNRAAASDEDDLTGALVRRAFTELTNAVLTERRRTSAPVSLLVIDVDKFKAVNDSYGHLTGDDALRTVVDVAREVLRPGQYVGRYAGDEFVVLLPGLDVTAAAGVADELRARVSALPIRVRDEPSREVVVTLSIGVASAPEHGATFDALFTSADRALLDAKREGRDKVVLAGGGSPVRPRLDFNQFVGREAELRSLHTALEASASGEPSVRVVLGEAGVGKSTLVRQLLPDVHRRAGVLAIGRALESTSPTPYGPWVDLIAQIDALELVPRREWPLLSRLLPTLGHDATGASVSALDTSQRHQLLRELARYLRSACEQRLLVLALEDMHWADSASWDALEYILSQLGTDRLCITLTVRKEDAVQGMTRDRLQRLSRNERARELRLERLSADEITDWLCSSLHHTSVGEKLVNFVLRHTEGNPFLVSQLLRTMEQESVFAYDGATWRWALPDALSLPSGMTDLLGRRLSALTPETKRTLVAAASIGRTFTLDLLAEVADVPMEQVLDAVDAALASSVIEFAIGRDDDAYQFAHALLVDAIAQTVSVTRRRMLHEKIGDVLQTRGTGPIATIASHYARSGNSGKAYTTCVRAANEALALYALDEAASFLALALERAGSDEGRASVHEDIAHVAELSGRWAEAKSACDALLAMPIVAGNPLRHLGTRLRHMQARARLGHEAESENVCRRLLADAEALESLPAIVQARSLLVQTLVRTGSVESAIREASDTLVLAEASGEQTFVAEAMYRLAITLNSARPADADALLVKLVSYSRSRHDRVMEARALLALGVSRSRTQNDEAGGAAFREALKIANQASALDVAANASMNLGVIEMRAGEFGSARDLFSASLQLNTTLRNNPKRLVALYNLAHIERERGDGKSALHLYAESAHLADELGAEDIAIGALAGLGLTALRLGNVAEAGVAFTRAQAQLGARVDWWFQGRELLEALAVRLDGERGATAATLARFSNAVARLESMESYTAAWFIADCALSVMHLNPSVLEITVRVGALPVVQQYLSMRARFNALMNITERA